LNSDLLTTVRSFFIIVGLGLSITSCVQKSENLKIEDRLSDKNLQLISLCRQGDAKTCKEVGVSIYQGEFRRDPDNDALALELLQRSCDAGYAEGCTWAGRVTYNSIGLRDRKGDYLLRSYELYGRACQLESAFGCNLLGQTYYSGAGPETNKDMSLRSFQRSCKLGFPNACTNVGWLHNEEGVADYDVVKARYFFNLACEQLDDKEGCEERAKLDGICITDCGGLTEAYWQRGRSAGQATFDPFNSWKLACSLGDDEICTKVASM